MKKLFKILKFIFQHPLGKNQKLRCVWRFLVWQIKSRIFSGPFIYSFVDKSKLLISKNMAGATGNIYVGLHEFHEMAFTLHMLRKNDLFLDIGANIGTYTILSSSAAKADTIAVEPIKASFEHLKKNILINKINNKVKVLNIGVGDKPGHVLFSEKEDTKNHVVTENDLNNNTVKVEIKQLDNFINKSPTLIKIDVEGYEYFVLKGAEKTLKDENLKAIIIEINNESEKYGIPGSETEKILIGLGFISYTYNAFTGTLTESKGNSSDNKLYIRDIDFVTKRINSSKKFNVVGNKI